MGRFPLRIAELRRSSTSKTSGKAPTAAAVLFKCIYGTQHSDKFLVAVLLVVVLFALSLFKCLPVILIAILFWLLRNFYRKKKACKSKRAEEPNEADNEARSKSAHTRREIKNTQKRKGTILFAFWWCCLCRSIELITNLEVASGVASALLNFECATTVRF